MFKMFKMFTLLTILLLSSCSTDSVPLGSMSNSGISFNDKIESVQKDQRYILADRYLNAEDLRSYTSILRQWDTMKDGISFEGNERSSWGQSCWTAAPGDLYEDCIEFQEYNLESAFYAQNYIGSQCGLSPHSNNNIYTPDFVSDVREALDEYFSCDMRTNDKIVSALVSSREIRRIPLFSEDGKAGAFAAMMIIVDDAMPLLGHDNGGCVDGNCLEEEDIDQEVATYTGAALGSMAMQGMAILADLHPISRAASFVLGGIGGMVIGHGCYNWWCSESDPPESPEEMASMVDPFLFDDFGGHTLCPEDPLLWDLP